VQTDRTISNNKLEIINRDDDKETCMLIEVAAVSGELNVI